MDWGQARFGGSPPGLTWRHERVELPREQELQEFLMDRAAEGGGGPQNLGPSAFAISHGATGGFVFFSVQTNLPA